MICPYLCVYVHIKQEKGKITTLGSTHFALNLDYLEEGKRRLEYRNEKVPKITGRQKRKRSGVNLYHQRV